MSDKHIKKCSECIYYDCEYTECARNTDLDITRAISDDGKPAKCPMRHSKVEYTWSDEGMGE